MEIKKIHEYISEQDIKDNIKTGNTRKKQATKEKKRSRNKLTTRAVKKIENRIRILYNKILQLGKDFPVGVSTPTNEFLDSFFH